VSRSLDYIMRRHTQKYGRDERTSLKQKYTKLDAEYDRLLSKAETWSDARDLFLKAGFSRKEATEAAVIFAV